MITSQASLILSQKGRKDEAKEKIHLSIRAHLGFPTLADLIVCFLSMYHDAAGSDHFAQKHLCLDCLEF